MLGGVKDGTELKVYQAEKYFSEQSGHGNVSMKTYFTTLPRGVKGRRQKRKSGRLVIL